MKISSPNIVNINQASDIVNNLRKKVIFWDTCALLDIVRFPRDNEFSSLVDLIRIHNAILNDQVYSMASEITIVEYNEHILSTLNESIEVIKKVNKQYNCIITLINHFTSSLSSTSSIDLPSYNLERYLVAIVHDILSKTIFIEKNDIAPVWLDRIVAKKTPLKRKGEYKDAAIWCTCLSLAEKTYFDTESENMLFFSSNVNDYYEAGSKNFNRDILTECSTYNMFFGINFTEINSKI